MHVDLSPFLFGRVEALRAAVGGPVDIVKQPDGLQVVTVERLFIQRSGYDLDELLRLVAEEVASLAVSP